MPGSATRQLPPALLQWVPVATRPPKFSAHHFLQMKVLTCAHMCVQRPATLPLAHRAVAAIQGTRSAEHSSAALQQPWLPIIAACLGWRFLWPIPVDLLACLMATSTPSPVLSGAGTDTEKTLEAGKDWKSVVLSEAWWLQCFQRCRISHGISLC